MSARIEAYGSSIREARKTGEQAHRRIESALEAGDATAATHEELLIEIEGLRATLAGPGPAKSPTGYGEDMVSSFLWEYVVHPLVLQLAALLGSVSLVGKILAKLGLRRAARRADQPASRVAALSSVDRVLTRVAIGSGLAVVLVLILSGIQPSRPQSIPVADLRELSSRLEGVEAAIGRLDRVPVEEGVASANALLAGVTVLSLAAALALLVTRKSPDVRSARTVRVRTVGADALTTRLVDPFLLALALLLLPSPADTLLLPFVVAHFVYAFFDVVRIHPHRDLARFVVNHYRLLIYLAFFGVWRRFLGEAVYLSRPVLDAIQGSIGIELPPALSVALGGVPFWWALGAAAIFAIPGWLRVQARCGRVDVPALRRSLDHSHAG